MRISRPVFSLRELYRRQFPRSNAKQFDLPATFCRESPSKVSDFISHITLMTHFIVLLLSILGFVVTEAVSSGTTTATTAATTAYRGNSRTPTPYPTPRFDPRDYLPRSPSGNAVHVSARSGRDLATLIQAAQDRTDVATVFIEGGGSITKQVTLKHHTVFDNSVYSCDVEGLTDF